MARKNSKSGTDTQRLNEVAPDRLIADSADQFQSLDGSITAAPVTSTGGSAKTTSSGPAAAAAAGSGQPQAVAPTAPDWFNPNTSPTVRTPSAGEYTFNGTAAADTLNGSAGVDIAQGLDGNDTLRGAGGNDILFGNLGADLLDGGDGNDLLVDDDPGALFTDQLLGGAGNDTLVFRGGPAGAPDLGDGGTGTDFAFIDVSDSSQSWRLASENGGLAFRLAADSSSLNRIQLSNFEVIGVRFGDGNDIAQTGNQRALIRGGGGNDQLTTGSGDDFIDGGTGDDRIVTGDGSDWLYGGTGNDDLEGGAGDDAYIIDSSNDFIVETSGNGTGDRVYSSVSYALGAGVDIEILSTDDENGTAAISFAGNELDNHLIGNAGANVLFGLTGDDILEGLLGNDQYIVNSASDRIVDGIGGGNDIVFATTSYQLESGQEIEILTPYDTGATDTLNLTGNEFAQIVFGNAGDNRLNGGGGADRLRGMNGNDTYIVDSTDDVVIELAVGGLDQVLSSVTYALTVEVENLILTGTAAINGTGNDSANIIRGNEAANVLLGGTNNDLIEGGAGVDTLDGGTGADTFFYREAGHSAGSVVDTINGFETGLDKIDLRVAGATSVSISSSGGINTVTAQTPTGTMTIRVNGTIAASDILLSTGSNQGTSGNDTLTGTTGDDVLDGGAGADTMSGGLGNDIYLVDNVGDVVIEAAGAGTDTVRSSVTYTLVANVENLTLSGSSGISAYGNELANVLLGNSAANILDGGAGADTMSGGTGDDVYVVDNTANSVVEADGAGNDTVHTSVSYSLAPAVENLVLDGTAAINGFGNTLNNNLFGNSGANTLDGGAGVDTMQGGLGNDLYFVNDSFDSVVETSASGGVDTVTSSASFALGANVENLILSGNGVINGTGNDLANNLTGNSAANALNGGAGNDLIEGGGGGDTLTGGSGADVFFYRSASNSAGSAIDTINGFEVGVDKVDLRGLGASSVSAVDNGGILTVTVQTLSGPMQFRFSGAVGGTVTASAFELGSTPGATPGDDTLTGTSGDDRLDGLQGADTLSGGLGNDTYVVDNFGDIIVENAGEGTDTVESSANHTLFANVENLTLTGAATISGTGNALNNVLIGNSAANFFNGLGGDDTIEGGGGADDLDGRAGADTFVYRNVSDSSGSAIDDIIDFETGVDKIDLRPVGATAVSWTVSGTTSTVTAVTPSGNLTIRVDGTVTTSDFLLSSGGGNGGNDVVTGTSGNDRLDGGPGADTMSGGLGNDTYVVDNSGDTTVENANAGTDTVESSVTHTLFANVENLTLTGAAAINGTGNELANVLTGNSAANNLFGLNGNDIIEGGGGGDLLAGASGADTYVYRNVSNSSGSSIDDILSFDTGVDKIDLRPVGATGVSWTFDGTTSTVTAQTPTGNLTIRVDGAVNTSDFLLAGGGGNGGNDVVTGTSGNDRLDGGPGADTMSGGLGNDTYVVDNSGDTTVENANAGTDTVESSVTHTLFANVENLVLTGSGAINGTGNALANLLTGNGGANILEGGGGADTLDGGGGADIFFYRNVSDSSGASTDTINGFQTGIDKVDLRTVGATGVGWVINGSTNTVSINTPTGTMNLLINGPISGTDFLLSTGSIQGTPGNDNLTGTPGDDLIDGAAGADTMAGGLGNDTYVVDNAGDSVVENNGAGTDTVQSSVTYTLGANVENLTLTGSGAINGTGNALANLLTGNAGANILEGGGGADTLNGGAGADVFFYRNVSDSSGGSADTINGFETGIDKIDLRSVGANGVAWSFNGTTNAVTIQTPTGTMNLTVNGPLLAFGDFLLSTGSNQGTPGNDNLQGTAGDDLLDGAAGADTMAGGLGNDTYVVDNVGDTVVENSGAGTDTVQSSLTYTLGANVENLILTGNGAINGTGNALANVLTGNSGANILEGAGGADTLDGGAGADVFFYRNVSDSSGASTDTINGFQTGIDKVDLRTVGATGIGWVINGSTNTVSINTPTGTMNLLINGPIAGTDFLLATSSIQGTAGNDNLTGTAGDDLIDGAAGADTMAGGLGNDTYVVDNAGDTVVEAAGAGTDTVRSSLSYTLGANVENLTLTGSGNFNGTGNALANVLTGNGGANILEGGGGADTLDGGAGADVFFYRNVSDSAGASTDTINGFQTGIDKIDLRTVGANAFNWTFNGSFSTVTIQTPGGQMNLVINSQVNVSDFQLFTGPTPGPDTLTGTAGDDFLDGAAGADTMSGGLGNDSYAVDNSGDTVNEAANAGTDTVFSSVTHTLGANVENLVLTGAGAINGTGNALANTLTGNGAANNLNGGIGADTMQGGAGNDTYVVDNSLDRAVETAAGNGTDTVQASVTFTLVGYVDNLVLTGAGTINGTGSAFANNLTGNAQANVLDGGAGADSMTGGLGNDTYIVDNAGDLIFEGAGAGTDLVRSTLSHTLAANVENLILTGATSTNGTGNALVNSITGNSGANVLNGAAGADTMNGEAGNDTYIVDNSLDRVFETSAANGTDTVQASVDYVLGANIENLILLGSTINGTGNALANSLTGNAAANVLNGFSGADIMRGYGGDDTYIVDNAGDLIGETPGNGTDTVQASVSYTLAPGVENLILTGGVAINGTGNAQNNALTGNIAANVLKGGFGNDVLSGGGGNDSLFGDGGNDLMTGGSGADRFTFQDTLGAGNADHIADFATGLDKIMLENSVFASLGAGPLAAGAFVVGTAAADANDRIIYDDATGNLYYDSDGTGAGAALLFATLDNVPANLAASDFMVI